MKSAGIIKTKTAFSKVSQHWERAILVNDGIQVQYQVLASRKQHDQSTQAKVKLLYYLQDWRCLTSSIDPGFRPWRCSGTILRPRSAPSWWARSRAVQWSPHKVRTTPTKTRKGQEKRHTPRRRCQSWRTTSPPSSPRCSSIYSADHSSTPARC